MKIFHILIIISYLHREHYAFLKAQIEGIKDKFTAEELKRLNEDLKKITELEKQYVTRRAKVRTGHNLVFTLEDGEEEKPAKTENDVKNNIAQAWAISK